MLPARPALGSSHVPLRHHVNGDTTSGFRPAPALTHIPMSSLYMLQCWLGGKEDDLCPLMSSTGVLLKQGCEQNVRFVCRK